MRSLLPSDGAGLLLRVQEECTREEIGWSERAGVLNNDWRTAKISVLPNPVGRDTKTSLPSQNAKIASIYLIFLFQKQGDILYAHAHT